MSSYNNAKSYNRDIKEVAKPTFIDKSILARSIEKVDLKSFEDWGTYLSEGKDKVSSVQLRKFFGAVRKIQADFDNKNEEILLLIPKLAYARARNGGKLSDLYALSETIFH